MKGNLNEDQRQQHIRLLLAFAEADALYRELLETAAGEEQIMRDDFMEATDRRAMALHELTEFELKHGLRPSVADQDTD